MFTCHDCQIEQPSQHSHGCGTGYAITESGEKRCYACCGTRDKALMIATGKATLYLTIDHGNRAWITNWPDSLRFAGHYSKGRHNIARVRYDVEFNGPDGHVWVGVTYGDNTQICHCRRTKRKIRTS